jgi:transposase InsO family protein
MDQKIEFVIRAVQSKEPMAALCREFGISRPTGYLWVSRYKATGSVAGLQERSRRPNTSPLRTTSSIEQDVVNLRRQWGWGAKKLQVLLRDQEGIHLPLVTINRIIKRNGLILPGTEAPKATQRFEKNSPNELWQMDFKGYYTTRHGKVFPLTILDDHSRFVVGLFAQKRTDRASVWRNLVRVFCEFGLPESMLMDHGTPWWGTTSEIGLSQLSVALLKQGIRLTYSGIGHPQTQGKVERFHRTLNQEIHRRGAPEIINSWTKLLNSIRRDYNEKRPHEALRMRPPSAVYKPSTRQFNPNPREWDYPPGSNVVTVKHSGVISYRNRAYLVSQALEGERVAIQRLGTKLAVTYRNTLLCELDLQSGRSTPLMRQV